MISIKELRRSFGPIVAVDGVSFDVQKGEVMGFLGPNGAGKSTVMRMLACFLKPDSGTATICGHDILKNPVEVRKCIGYLAENVPAYGEMTVGSSEFCMRRPSNYRQKQQRGNRPHRVDVLNCIGVSSDDRDAVKGL